MPAVQSGIDWTGSYSCRWRLCEVDEGTWASAGELGGCTAAAISRDATGKLLESGSATVSGGEAREIWARVELLATQGGAMERQPVSTVRLVPKPETLGRGGGSMGYDAFGVMKPAERTHLLPGVTVRAGTDCAAWVVSLLSSVVPAPVSAEGGFELAEHMVFDGGTDLAAAAWQVVDAAGWCIQQTVEGALVVRRKPRESSFEMTGAVLGGSVRAWDFDSSAPNRYVAVDDERMAYAQDDDPASPTSTVSRGEVVEKYDGHPKRAAGEGLQQYAERRLADLTESIGGRSYRRAWLPGVTVFDAFHGSVADAKMDGWFRIVKQSLSFGAGVSLEEECEVMRWESLTI